MNRTVRLSNQKSRGDIKKFCQCYFQFMCHKEKKHKIESSACWDIASILLSALNCIF